MGNASQVAATIAAALEHIEELKQSVEFHEAEAAEARAALAQLRESLSDKPVVPAKGTKRKPRQARGLPAADGRTIVPGGEGGVSDPGREF